jgi:hypothetical protein
MVEQFLTYMWNPLGRKYFRNNYIYFSKYQYKRLKDRCPFGAGKFKYEILKTS